MKKVLFAICLICFTGVVAQAQDGKKTTTETKVKRTSSPKQKVHNVIHPKHKKYNGVKVKHETKTKH